jgi:hypothetical protein
MFEKCATDASSMQKHDSSQTRIIVSKSSQCHCQNPNDILCNNCIVEFIKHGKVGIKSKEEDILGKIPSNMQRFMTDTCTAPRAVCGARGMTVIERRGI